MRLPRTAHTITSANFSHTPNARISAWKPNPVQQYFYKKPNFPPTPMSVPKKFGSGPKQPKQSLTEPLLPPLRHGLSPSAPHQTGLPSKITGSNAQEQTPIDPLDLVIAKRKKKELADPVIAEAILTASKLPPPRILEAQDSKDVPKEIQQLISFGFARHSCDAETLEFLKNYSLDQRRITKPQIVTLRHPSRYESLKRKYLSLSIPHRKSRKEEEEEEERRLYAEDAAAGFSADGIRRDITASTVHSDEDWFMEKVLHVICILLIIITLPLSLIFCLKVVAHYERAVLFRLGRLVSATAQGPGLIIVLPCLDRYRILDLRTFTFDVPTQEVLTKDSVTVVVNAVVYYRVRDPVRAVVNVEDANRATRVLGQTTLRNVLGTVNLDQLLTAREDIAALMQECLDSVTEAWGVKVERVEIKDVRLPIQLQRAMAAEAESVREATAKVIAAEGEMRAAGALKSAAFEIQQHPMAMQLRYLQAMNSVASGKESTIIFPVPLDLLSFFRVQVDSEIVEGGAQILDRKESKQLFQHIQESIEDLEAHMEQEQSATHLLDIDNLGFSDEQLDTPAQIV